ncbi:MAG: very short patch repair endonuclease [Dethiobacteria bacterium]
MSRVRNKDTSPEKIVRTTVHRLGYRFRLHRNDLPGKPDLVFPSRHKVIFVHGCFWHGHQCKRGNRLPKTNQTYWFNKINRNIERDKEHKNKLEIMGWKVLTIWECEVKNKDFLENVIVSFLDS